LTTLLRGAPEGKWIALSEDWERVIGVGDTLEEAIRVARDNGEQSPFITKVPPATALIFSLTER
jgi:hypothetical protein